MSLKFRTPSSQLSEDHFKAIGKLVVEWANIEFLLRQILSKLLLTPVFCGRSYTDRMSSATVQKTILEALSLHEGRFCYYIVPRKTIEEITKINNRISKLRSTRNKFAHFCWWRFDDEHIFGMNFSGGLPGTKKHEAGQLKIKISEMNNLHHEFCEIVEKLNQITEMLLEIDEKELFERLARLQKKKTSSAH